MDTIAHAAWGATIVRKPPLIWWAALSGALPDIIPATYMWLRQRGRITRGVVALQEDFPEDDSYVTVYYWTHSFIPISILAIVLTAVEPVYLMLTVPYYLHLLMDIFSHRGLWATRIFYPFSDIHFNFVNWWDKRWITAANWAALIIVNLLIYIVA